MRIFVDNGISHVIASIPDGCVAHLGHTAVHIRDLPCRPHASDIAWIGDLRASPDDRLVLTGDLRVSRNRPEPLAFAQANLKGIALTPAFQNMPMHRRAATILWRWADIENVAAHLRPPFLLELPVKKSIELRNLNL